MERGELIHRMWRSSQELFETLITDLTRVTAELQSKLRQAQEQLEHIEAEAEETARKNKREMEQAISLALMKSTSVEDSPVFM
eukprot:gene2765-3371_t